ncbi:MAG: hypothetical protein U5L75_02525 [Candidatus Campbellbacteria bacterium]|nr:hypothetical protein [Candidatus Campbellbacteria bacterium]
MQFALQYVSWHYSRGVHDIVVLWSNFIWFLSHFFSIPLLASTLFSPWKRLHEEPKDGFDLEDFFSAILVNIMMRLVGFFMRLTMIAVGLAVLALALLGLIIDLAFWLLWPAVIGVLLFFGFSLLIA